MAKKEYQNPSGGLNAAGRKHYGVKAPVSKGTNTVEIRMRLPARLSEGNDQVVICYWGGQLYLHNFYR